MINYTIVQLMLFNDKEINRSFFVYGLTAIHLKSDFHANVNTLIFSQFYYYYLLFWECSKEFLLFCPPQFIFTTISTFDAITTMQYNIHNRKLPAKGKPTEQFDAP